MAEGRKNVVIPVSDLVFKAVLRIRRIPTPNYNISKLVKMPEAKQYARHTSIEFEVSISMTLDGTFWRDKLGIGVGCLEVTCEVRCESRGLEERSLHTEIQVMYRVCSNDIPAILVRQ